MSLGTSVDDREVEASRRLAEVLDPSVIDALLADAQATGTPIDGVDGLGNFYVANAGTNTVTGYHVDPAGTPTVFTQTPTRENPIDLAVTRDGQFLYVEVGGAGGVDGFRIKPDGTLAQIVTLTALNGLEGIAVT